jgi:inosine-uridine nucleoside N-ribohydrolase
MFFFVLIIFVTLCELVMHADDAMAIFLALRSPEVEVIGLTTIYGNVYTTLATRNALHLV